MAVVINGTTGIDKVQDGSIGTADIPQMNNSERKASNELSARINNCMHCWAACK